MFFATNHNSATHDLNQTSATGWSSPQQPVTPSSYSDPKMNVAEAATRYIYEGVRRGNFAPTTATSYRSILRAFARESGDPRTTALTRRHVARWYGTLDCAPSTTRHRLSVVQTFCQWLVLNGHTPRDPSLGFKPPAQPKYLPRNLTADECEATLAACPDARARLIVTLMLQLGLRCVEVSNLEVGDIDRSAGLALIRGKGRHERVLPVTCEAELALRAYLAEHPATSGPLVRSYQRPWKPLSPGYISNRVALWMRQAGVKEQARDGKSAHAGRHTCFTDMLVSGANVRQVQAAAGHQSLQTTQRYLGWNVEELRGAMEGRTYSAPAPIPD